MNGYVKSSVCHSMSGFIRYCRTGTKNDREDYKTEYSTAPFEFWSELAKENRIRHKENKLNKNKKAVEGRQLMVKIDKDNHITAEQFAKHLKKILGVEVFVFEHWKGNNRHFHIIIADRTKLKEPIPARFSPRTYYYDAQGKKCKKADAVKVVPKGTVLNAEQKFSEKIDEFRTKDWLENLKSELFKYLDMTKFDNEKQFAFETIGTQKVKSDDVEYVSAAKERNKFRAELNIYLADENTPSKKEFCEYCGISPRTKYIPNAKISEIKELFAKFKELYPINQKTAENGFESFTEPIKETVTDQEQNYFSDWSDEELDNELTYWKQQLDYQEKNYKVAETTAIQLDLKGSVEEVKGKRTLEQLNEVYKTKNKSIDYMLGMIKGIINKIKENISLLVDEIKVRNNVANSNLNYDYEKSEPEQDKEDDYEIEM